MVVPRHVTWVMPVFGAHPIWQDSETTELSVRESACTTSELLPKYLI